MENKRLKLSIKDVDKHIVAECDKWPSFRENSDKYGVATKHIEPRLLPDHNFWVKIFSVDYRRASSTADVAKALSGERPCFLCANNRPAEQSAIDWDGYEILVNPNPLDDFHLTIASKEHKPQLISPNIRDMVRLTRVLPDHMIFYNGPHCGASAPDHLHFQAVHIYNMRNFLTASIPFKNERNACLFLSRHDASLFPFFTILSGNDPDLFRLFDYVMSMLPVREGETEPRVNVYAWKAKGDTMVIIVPRKAHRPSCYGEGDDQLLISPAALELAGVFALPRQEDIAKLTDEKIVEILREVTFGLDDIVDVLEKIRANAKD